MRRLAPLLLAFAAGCGGSDPSDAPRPFLRLAGGDTEELGTGIDAQGAAALVGVDSDGTMRVVTGSGAARFAIPPAVPSAPPRVAGDFVLAPGASGGVVPASGTTILDRRTGTHRFNEGEFPAASDGTRVVWETEDGFVLEDLATRTRTPVADAEIVASIRGGWIVVGKQIGTTDVEGFPVPDFGYFLQPIVGGARIALAPPEGYDGETPAFVGEDGTVVGTAHALGDPLGNDLPSSVVRWTAQGTPSVPAPALRGFPLAVRNDGSLLLQERATDRLLLLRENKATPLGLRAALPTASPDGTVVFIQAEDSKSISAYRFP